VLATGNDKAGDDPHDQAEDDKPDHPPASLLDRTSCHRRGERPASDSELEDKT
jgi:hypothetical protein